MRVVYVNPDPGIGPGRKKGAAVHVAALQQAFRSLGCEVVALEEKDPERLGEALDPLLSDRRVELVYERYALGAEAAGQVSRRRRVPHVIEVNAPLLEEASEHRGVAIGPAERAREARLLGAASHVFAVSNAVAEHVGELGVPSERIHVHPNAVDTERFRPRSDDGHRSRLSVAPETFVIGFHGRLRPWHGFERVARAARGLVERGRDVHVLTVGEGDYAGTLAAEGLSSRSTHLPWVPHEEVPALVACFDALALGYAPDASCYFSPLKLAEAMACGVVPVVPDLGDLPDQLEGGACGLIYPAGSLEELVEALDLLASDPASRAALAQRAVAAAQSRSWTAIARAALDLAGAERAS